MNKELYGFIYLTTNKVNGKKYIGQRHYDKRNKWKEYLGSGKLVKKAIKKYGKNNFEIEILENCKTKQILNEREKYWIKKYNAVENNLFYNIASGGDGGNVIAGFSEERRNELKQLHSKRSKEYIPSCEESYSAKLSKEQFNDIINMIMQGYYDIEIGKKHNVSNSTIYDIRQHKTWCKYTENMKFPKQKRRCGQTKKKIIQYDLDGVQIEIYESARDCERQTGIGYKLISAVCNGSKKTTHGYIFRFYGDSIDKYDYKNTHKIKISKISTEFKIIEKFNSVREAEKSIGDKNITVSRNGKLKLSHGFYWCSDEDIATYKITLE